jgi:uncharacterized protein
MATRQSWVRDLIFRASRARDAEELEKLQKEAGEKMGDAVGTETSGGNTGEPGKTPEGESLHIHLHQPGGEASVGAGGSASTTGDDFPPANGGGGGGGDPAMQSILQAITALSAKVDQLCSALGGGNGGGSPPPADDGAPMGSPQWSDPEHDGNLDIHHSADNDPEEKFDPDANKKISVGGFGAETPPGASGGQNKGSHDRSRGRGRDSFARDSAGLSETWMDTMALAEIINPGVRVPTFDRSARAALTLDQMCRFRRRTLNTVYDTDTDMHNLIDNLVDSPNGYSPTARMTCDSVTALFRSVAQVKRERNNASMGRDGLAAFVGIPNSGFRSSNPHQEAAAIASLNQRNRESAEKLWGTGTGVAP